MVTLLLRNQLQLVLALCAGVALAGVPVARAQPTGAIYVAATGHHLDDTLGLLTFWQTNGAEALLGLPVTEPLDEGGITVQYFQHARLEHHPELPETPVLIGLVGVDYAAAQWLSFAPPPPRRNRAGEQFFAATGHTLRDPFLAFWQANRGEALMGAPISEPLWESFREKQVQVQYFQRMRLVYDPLTGLIQPGELGRALALLRGHPVAPVPNRGVPVYGGPAAATPCLGLACTPTAPTATPVPAPPAVASPAQPAPAPRPARGSERTIVVDLSDQWLYAYEDGAQVFDAPVSTGKDGFNTPTGGFAVYAKLRSQTMSGTLGGESYYVPNVPHVMYIVGGVALHGTYWHNQFGTGVRRSHGCVNLSLESAAWLYSWASVGTPVTVRN